MSNWLEKLPKKWSMIDTLAKDVGDKTGTIIVVDRIWGPADKLRRRTLKAYRLTAIRLSDTEFDGMTEFTSGELRPTEAKKWLALLSDWIGRGIIKVQK